MIKRKPQASTGPQTPRHVAIIMDGNGRWARKRLLPRFAGHRAGVEAVRKIISASLDRGVEVLTLFAFSSENWRRPEEEVGHLMSLFVTVLEKEIKRLMEHNVRVRFIGERVGFVPKLRDLMDRTEARTADNTAMTLVIAANYGGRWDIAQACRSVAEDVATGKLTPDAVDAELINARISIADLPEPDLFIRTGGEQRVSNFLLWQLAYTELYFTDELWPDFDAESYDKALASFASRQRRFGRTGDQVEQAKKGRHA